jgi:hypothetical protein
MFFLCVCSLSLPLARGFLVTDPQGCRQVPPQSPEEQGPVDARPWVPGAADEPEAAGYGDLAQALHGFNLTLFIL